MRSYFLIVSVGVEYPALPSTMGCVGFVGLILALKGQVFSSSLYKYIPTVYSINILFEKIGTYIQFWYRRGK